MSFPSLGVLVVAGPRVAHLSWPLFPRRPAIEVLAEHHVDQTKQLKTRTFFALKSPSFLHWKRLTCVGSLKKAQADSAALTPEYVAANMAPEEKLRLSRVRNIGIAVGGSIALASRPCHPTRLTHGLGAY